MWLFLYINKRERMWNKFIKKATKKVVATIIIALDSYLKI